MDVTRPPSKFHSVQHLRKEHGIVFANDWTPQRQKELTSLVEIEPLFHTEQITHFAAKVIPQH